MLPIPHPLSLLLLVPGFTDPLVACGPPLWSASSRGVAPGAGSRSTGVQEPAPAPPSVSAVSRFARDPLFPDPVALGIMPGRRAMYVAQRTGRVSWVELGGDAEAEAVRVLLEVDVRAESGAEGLLGFAPHPTYVDTLKVYAHYTPRDARRSRVSEFICARGV